MFHFDPSNIGLHKHDFSSRIWKVRTDPFSDWVALEFRDPDSQIASFAVVNLRETSLATPPLVHPMDWWQGIEDFRDGIVLLHGYEEKGVPIHEGLWAYDRAGNLLWAAPEVRCEGMVDGGIAVAMPLTANGRVSVLDVKLGTEKATFRDRLAPDLRLGLLAYETLRVADLQFPELVSVDDPRYSHCCDQLGVTPFGAVNLCLQDDDFWQLAWHEGTPQAGFALALAMFRGDELLLDGWLEEGMKGMHPDPFFLSANRLISIVDRQSLLVVETLKE